MIAQQYYLFLAIQKSNKQLISLDMVEFIIFKLYQIIGCHNNWKFMNFKDDGTNE